MRLFAIISPPFLSSTSTDRSHPSPKDATFTISTPYLIIAIYASATITTTNYIDIPPILYGILPIVII